MGRGEEKEKCLSAPVFGNVSKVLFRWAANKQWIKNDNVGVFIHKRNELHNSVTANHTWTRMCFFTNSTNCSGVPASTNDRITEERMYEHRRPYDFLSNPHCYYIKHRAENLKNPPTPIHLFFHIQMRPILPNFPQLAKWGKLLSALRSGTECQLVCRFVSSYAIN